MRAFAPNGSPIVGTAEIVYATALVSEASYQRAEDGSLDFEYDGETEIDWDTQETQKEKGQRLFIAEDGQTWRETQIVLREE